MLKIQSRLARTALHPVETYFFRQIALQNGEWYLTRCGACKIHGYEGHQRHAETAETIESVVAGLAGTASLGRTRS
jgi:hypothetical protein